MKSFHVFLIVLIIVSVVAFAFQGSCNMGTYASGSKLLHPGSLQMSRFEGFMSKPNTENNLVYSSYSPVGNVPQQNPAEVEKAYMKIDGFSGIYSSPDTADRKDFFYGTEGSLDAKPLGYSNSRGYLVLNDQQKKLLMTRGGNASGVDSQIGAY